MPSFSDIKARAVKVKDSGIEKAQNVRDKNSSVPMKKTNWDPYSGQLPTPLPPPRTRANTKPEKPALLPPPSRTGGARTASAMSSSSSSSSAATAAASPPPRLPGRPALAPPKLPARSLSAIAPPLPPRGVSPAPTPASAPAPAPAPAPPPFITRSTRPIQTLSTESPPPAPVARTLSAPTYSRPRPQPEQSTTGFNKAPIDWTNLSRNDKDALFRWLDEYFSRSLNITA